MKFMVRLFLMLLLLAVGVVFYSFHVARTPFVAQETTVVIERGTGARAMLEQLHQQGVLPAPWKIMLPVVMRGDYRSFKAGEYRFAQGLAPQQVVASLARGEVVVHAFTVPEGWNVAQLRAGLLREPLLTGDLPAIIPEGSVSPTTIHFHRGDSRASVVERLQAQQRTILEAAWQRRVEDLPVATPEQALILASIVEKETGIADERGIVAAVFVNRLRMGMMLQSDPTVAYGIAPHGLGRALTSGDLKRDTPYNTYTRVGLPPTPICNPGAESIAAVVNPPVSDALYFVATGNGGHHFARTLAEHNLNVSRYRAALRAK